MCKCEHKYTKKPQDSCLYCAEKHISTAMQAYKEQGYLENNRQLIIGELELARKHLEDYQDLAQKIRELRHNIQNRRIKVFKYKWDEVCNLLNFHIDRAENVNQPGKIYIFSNVSADEKNKIITNKQDYLVFLNKAVTYPQYKSNLGHKICYRRSKQESYGNDIEGISNKFVFGDDKHSCIDKLFLAELKKSYDWNYQIEQGKVKCMTTGYMVTEFMHKLHPDKEIVLVNFGYQVSNSTYRCPWHNWKFEAEALKKYKHIYTAKHADVSGDKPLKLLINASSYLGDNVALTAVIHNIAETGKFKVNVNTNHPAVWENNPYLDKSIDETNADYIIRQGYNQNWKQNTKHMQELLTARIADTINIPIECKYIKPEIYADLGQPIFKSDKPVVLFSNGFQNSAPTKKYFNQYWQEIIDANPDFQFVQVGQTKNHAVQLKNTVSFIDKTDCKGLANLIYNADCIISVPSGIMHLAGAFNKPCLVLSGGRQPANLTKYDNAYYFSAINKLDCCMRKGCHRNKFETDNEAKKCLHCTKINDEITADCQLMTKPEMVTDALKKIITIDDNTIIKQL